MRSDRLALSGVLVVLTGLACACGGGPEPSTSTIVVVVTLSRDGCPLSTPMCGVGPSFDHAPQAGERVTVTSAAGRTWSGATDADGVARVVVPGGAYEVDARGTDMGPQAATVRPGDTIRVRFDAVAP